MRNHPKFTESHDSAARSVGYEGAREILCANCNRPIVYFGENAMWWHVESSDDCYRECFRKPGMIKATPGGSMEWISTAKQLPPNDLEVRTIVQFMDGKPYQALGIHRGNGIWLYGKDSGFTVTHWQNATEQA